MEAKKIIKFEFKDGTTESYDADKVVVVTESFAGEQTLERKIDKALIKGGIFEVPPPPKHSLIEKIKITSHSIRKVTLIKKE